ncbi:MAG: RnfABCDGE type electron transport complex subunit D [Deltaproteobacteria bacterium]|nr:RnfABCDGE type electron transport complex subunit D [Deltaproteobacteria bacterium]
MGERRLLLQPGPHLHDTLSTREIMWWVSASIAPAFLFSLWVFGLQVLWLIISGIAGALAGEYLVNKGRGQHPTLKDGSAVLTGLLLVGTLSPGLPLWMPAIGSFAGIIFAKMLFGGLGFNVFNPALVGRAFLMACFPLSMTTTWIAPRTAGIPDAVTQATPLALVKLQGIEHAFTTLGVNASYYTKLFLGLRSGSIGEISVLLILLGAFVLVWKKIIKLTIPLSVIAGLLAVSFFSGIPLFHLLTGGLWFGAFYMATDYVTAPLMPRGQIIFGFCIGVLTGVIRIYGGYPEGICYAILILNTLTPALNHWFRPVRPTWEGAPS